MGDRLRAVATRGQAAGTAREQATVVRLYDNSGGVKREFVFRDGVKFRRNSTLPRELATRPLSDFSSTAPRASLAVSSAAILSELTWYDTTTQGVVTLHDSLWSNMPGIADFVQEASDSNRILFGDFWYSGTSTDSLLDADGMTAYVPLDTFGFLGVEVYGDDFDDIKSLYLAHLTSALQSKPGGGSVDSRRLIGDAMRGLVAESTRAAMSEAGLAQARMMQDEWPENGPCDLELYNAQMWAASAVFVAGRTIVACKGLRKFTAGCAIHKGLSGFFAAGAASAAFEYHNCIRFNGGGVAVYSDPRNDQP
jgi:hypothetical protein